MLYNYGTRALLWLVSKSCQVPWRNGTYNYSIVTSPLSDIIITSTKQIRFVTLEDGVLNLRACDLDMRSIPACGIYYCFDFHIDESFCGNFFRSLAKR